MLLMKEAQKLGLPLPHASGSAGSGHGADAPVTLSQLRALVQPQQPSSPGIHLQMLNDGSGHLGSMSPGMRAPLSPDMRAPMSPGMGPASHHGAHMLALGDAPHAGHATGGVSGMHPSLFQFCPKLRNSSVP